jgi:hypothetical protein
MSRTKDTIRSSFSIKLAQICQETRDIPSDLREPRYDLTCYAVGVHPNVPRMIVEALH